jgi:FdhD protein
MGLAGPVTIRRMTDPRTSKIAIERHRGPGAEVSTEHDLVAVEEPLEIQVGVGEAGWKTVSITMRTPGHDSELATGFLFTEGIVGGTEDVVGVEHCGPPAGPGGTRNVIRVRLAPSVRPAIERLDRNFYTASSCGVCGKTSIEAVQLARRPVLGAGPAIRRDLLGTLPARLHEAQDVFRTTGGLHAAALFDADGNLVAHGEDVGRHNAVDKVVGALLAEGRLPATDTLLVVSGRAGFELVQKALMASIPAMVAIGAPSSLAVELAREFGMTLAGFVRDGQFNVYSGGERIA